VEGGATRRRVHVSLLVRGWRPPRPQRWWPVSPMACAPTSWPLTPKIPAKCRVIRNGIATTEYPPEPEPPMCSSATALDLVRPYVYCGRYRQKACRPAKRQASGWSPPAQLVLAGPGAARHTRGSSARWTELVDGLRAQVRRVWISREVPKRSHPDNTNATVFRIPSIYEPIGIVQPGGPGRGLCAGLPAQVG